MRRYLDPTAREHAEDRRRAEGLTGAELVAAVTADQIHAALVRHGADDPVATPAEFADAALPLATTEDELLHLQRVASYFTPPTPERRDASRGITSGARS